LAGSAVGVGRSGVCAWETFTVIQEIPQVPGIARIGIDFLRVGRAADMPHEASSPTLAQVHTLGVANATNACLGTATVGIADRTIQIANVETVAEAEQCDFINISYEISFPDDQPDEGLFQMGHEASSPTVGNTPSLTPVAATQGHTVSGPSTLVNHSVGVANAIMPHLAGNSGFGRVQNVANAVMDHAVVAPLINKIIVPQAVVWSMQATTNSTRRLYQTDGADAVMGHIALPSGVSPDKINTTLASSGFTATPAAITFLARTFPHESTTAMIVSPPTMSQNIVAPSEAVGTFFGTRIGATGVTVLTIGDSGTHPNNNAAAIRFRAEKTAAVSAISILTLGGTGFTLGEAVWEARILRDDGTSNHLPVDSQRTGVTTQGDTVTYTGTSAHVGAVSDRIQVSGIETSAVQTFTWTSGKPSLTANNIYHLEIRNVHAIPNNNFAAMQTLAMTVGQSAQPGIPQTDLGMSRRGATGVWSARPNGVPTMAIFYDGAKHQGQSYRDCPLTPLPSITGPLNKVRQRFVSPGMTINTIGYRVGRWSGQQELQVRIIQESNGSTLLSAAADWDNWSLITNQADSRSEHRWHRNSFASALTIPANVTAALEFRTTANAEYRAFVLDPEDTFPASAAFRSGQAQFTNDGTNWQTIGNTGTDVQFYFRTGSAAPGPTCVADSLVSGFVIGSSRTVLASELLANDTNPSGTSATTNFPNGVNPLVLHAVNSASNCTAVLTTASQTVRVTAQASAGAFTYVAKDIYGQKSSARVSFVAFPDSQPPASTTTLNYFGNPYRFTGMGNTQLNPESVGWRFTANKTGLVSSVRVYIRINRPNPPTSDDDYSLGTGGTCRVSLWSANGSNLPGTRLSGYDSYNPGTYDNPGTDEGFSGGNGGYGQSFHAQFASPVQVSAGTRYYIVIENTHSSPGSNYFSTNALHQTNITSESQARTPGISNADQGEVLGPAASVGSNAPGWSFSRYHKHPVYCVFYQDGWSQGVGYVDPTLESLGCSPGLISATNQVRQVFVAPASKTATHVNIAIQRRSGSGTVVAELMNGAGTTVLATATWNSTQTAAFGTTYPPLWPSSGEIALNTSVALTQGTTYILRFRGTSTIVCASLAGRDASYTGSDGGSANNDWNYSTNTAVNGRAEISSNSGSTWTGWTIFNNTNDSRGDLCAYLRVS
jgi:hypothetical protein